MLQIESLKALLSKKAAMQTKETGRMDKYRAAMDKLDAQIAQLQGVIRQSLEVLGIVEKVSEPAPVAPEYPPVRNCCNAIFTVLMAGSSMARNTLIEKVLKHYPHYTRSTVAVSLAQCQYRDGQLKDAKTGLTGYIWVGTDNDDGRVYLYRKCYGSR